MVSNAAATQGRMKNGKRSLDLELGGFGRSWSLSSLHWGNTGALGWLRPTSRLPPPLPLGLQLLLHFGPSPLSELRALLFQGGSGQIKAVFFEKASLPGGIVLML